MTSGLRSTEPLPIGGVVTTIEFISSLQKTQRSREETSQFRDRTVQKTACLEASNMKAVVKMQILTFFS